MDLEALLQMCRGYETKKLYAWLKSDGTLIGSPDDNYERIAALEKEMQEVANKIDYHVRLVEFKNKETRIRLNPPPKPGPRHCGGHAIGGFTAHNIDDIRAEFQRIFKKQYPSEYEVWIWSDDANAYAEYKNVRCWVSGDNNLGMDVEYNLKKKWRAYVTMIENWNSEYHNIHLGDFRDGTDAVTEAFFAFVRYQIEEQTIDDFF